MDHYAESARTLSLVAIILVAVFTGLVWLWFAILFGAAFAMNPPSGNSFPMFPLYIPAMTIFGIAAAAFGLLWIFLDYFLIYKRIVTGNLAGAKDTSLILGILQLLFGGVVPGILLIVAYVQIDNSLHQSVNNQRL